jgi:hypothetical protein
MSSDHLPTPFSNYAMVAIAGIGRKPDTIEDRAVNITMRQQLPGERGAKLRLRTDLPEQHALRSRITEWASGHMDELEKLPAHAADGAVRPGWSALHGRWTSSIGSVDPTALLPL